MIGPISNIHNGYTDNGYGQNNQPTQCPHTDGTVWQEWEEEDVAQWEDNNDVTINCDGK